MRTIKEIRYAIMSEVYQIGACIDADNEKQDEILRKYINEIIDKCADVMWDEVRADITYLEKVKEQIK